MKLLAPSWPCLTWGMLIGLALCTPVLASPLLRCEVTYAGQTHHLKFEPTAHPYAAQPVDIAHRFLWSSGQINIIYIICIIRIRDHDNELSGRKVGDFKCALWIGSYKLYQNRILGS